MLSVQTMRKDAEKIKNDRYLTQANPVVSLSNALWNFVTTPLPQKKIHRAHA